MQINRRYNSSVKSLAKAQARDKVGTIRDSLIELRKLTAPESELKTLTYLIEMALQETGSPNKA